MKNLIYYLLIFVVIIGGGYLGLKLLDQEPPEPPEPPVQDELAEEALPKARVDTPDLPELKVDQTELVYIAQSISFMDRWAPEVYGPLDNEFAPTFYRKMEDILVGLESEWQSSTPKDRPNIEAAGLAMRQLEKSARHYSEALQRYKQQESEPLPGIRNNATKAAIDDAKDNRQFFLDNLQKDWRKKAESLQQKLKAYQSRIQLPSSES